MMALCSRHNNNMKMDAQRANNMKESEMDVEAQRAPETTIRTGKTHRNAGLYFGAAIVSLVFMGHSAITLSNRRQLADITAIGRANQKNVEKEKERCGLCEITEGGRIQCALEGKCAHCYEGCPTRLGRENCCNETWVEATAEKCAANRCCYPSKSSMVSCCRLIPSVACLWRDWTPSDTCCCDRCCGIFPNPFKCLLRWCPFRCSYYQDSGINGKANFDGDCWDTFNERDCCTTCDCCGSESARCTKTRCLLNIPCCNVALLAYISVFICAFICCITLTTLWRDIGNGVEFNLVLEEVGKSFTDPSSVGQLFEDAF